MAVCFWAKRKRLYGAALLVTLLMLGPASHYGGSMTHGRDYLTAYAPRWFRSLTGEAPTTQPVAQRPRITEPGQARAFADVVQPILAQNCVSCHSAEKLKGQLRLDTFDAIHKGGAGGAAVVAGNANESPLVQRILLPVADPKHMPPAGKPQLSDDQLAVVRWWVDAGAPADGTVESLDPPLNVGDAIAGVLGLPKDVTSAEPRPLDDLGPQIVQLNDKLGLVIEPVVADQPWLACNASRARVFGDAELAQLAPLAANVTSLNLSGTGVTDAGLATVAGMHNLQRLRLERTKVSDAGLRQLAKLRHLDYLNLYGTPVTAAGLKSLRGLPSLHQLYLWQTKIDPDAAKAFEQAKTDRAKIRRLQEQIAALQVQIKDETIEVYGAAPTSRPTTAPTIVATTAPATAPATGPTTASTTAPTTAPSPALVNALCPVSGKPVDPTKVADFQGMHVAFCCDNCLAAFKKDPAKYSAKLAVAAADGAKTPPPAESSKPPAGAKAN
jgi:mono/diheme cytochrome c family protein/YHS domain-containing protein